MSYIACAVYHLDGEFQGYVIKNEDAPKLQSTNLYLDSETDKLNEQLARLNEDVDLRRYWPHVQDPEVQALLNDPAFMPIEQEEREVVDDDHSYYVWMQEAEVDDRGNPTGRLIDGSNLDEEASVIRYKRAMVPKRQTDVLWRIKKACEVVARRRAGLLSSSE